MGKKQMRLGAFINTFLGHHLAAWRHPNTKPEDITNLDLYVQMAKKAEEGKFDIVFVADSLTIIESDMGYGPHIRIDPLILLSAIAANTKKIGVVPTISTSYNEPFHIARKLSSLDHLSKGRTGWNLVTSSLDEEARNFSREKHYEHDERYDRAEEFIEVCNKLWDAWEPDAIIADQKTGNYIDMSKLKKINHRGKYFSVEGPLNVPYSPQGHPVLVQAGASKRGKDFAAKYAEVLFTIAPKTIEEGIENYNEIKKKVLEYGRDPEDLKIMPGIVPFVGKTTEEAYEKFELMQNLIHEKLGLSILSKYLGVDLSKYDLQGPLPELPDLEEINMEKGRYEVLRELSIQNGLTIAQLGRHFANNQGHLMIIGSPTEVADFMEKWFVSGACDGFNVKFPYFPDAVTDFVDLVIPELQKRGLFRTEYEGLTLRDHLGLKSLDNRRKLIGN